MTSLVIRKTMIQDFLTEFIANIRDNDLKIEFDERFFIIRRVEENSVLDMLSLQADDLGTEDLSANVDHYLYGLPKRN